MPFVLFNNGYLHKKERRGDFSTERDSDAGNGRGVGAAPRPSSITAEPAPALLLGP